MLTARPKHVHSLVIHKIPTKFYIAERSTVGGASGRRFMSRGDEMVELSKDTLPEACYAAIPKGSLFETGPQDWVPFVNRCLSERIFTEVVR